MKERLQKILSARGICSRRAAETMISQGRVTVNGCVALLGESADPEADRICVDGSPISGGQSHVYLMLHKPRGYVTTLSDEKGRKDVASLVQNCGTRVYPVGRLDMDSEGLLLFTNDGAFANKLMHPRGEVEKRYEVHISGYRPGVVELLSRPVTMDGYTIRPPEVELLRAEGSRAALHIVIHEGRNRQIRRMCEAAGVRVTKLKRLQEGALSLGDLPLGKWRYLTEKEIAEL